MKKRIAFHLRKLADLFDEKIEPSNGSALTVSINADTSQFMESMAAVEATIERLLPQMEKLREVGFQVEGK